ncbi:MAG: hypothetical protein FWC47_13420 [Oscillospiraceae bacterium]|nr:hypothetical protein [Oscillospiraceae bacterium]
MKKKLVICALIIFIGMVFYSAYNFVYNKYYKIDYASFSYYYGTNIEKSPDKQHVVSMTVCREEENNAISYIIGIVATRGIMTIILIILRQFFFRKLIQKV